MFEIGDLLAVAEKLLGIDATRLKLMVNIPSAESALAAPFAGVADQMFYEHPVQRAAILASRLIRNHPLPDGNKRAALYLMDLYLEENGYELHASPEEIDSMFRAVAAREHSEDYFRRMGLFTRRAHVAPSAKHRPVLAPAAARLTARDAGTLLTL